MAHYILLDRHHGSTLNVTLAGVGTYHWNLKSYFRRIKDGDSVLLWQAHSDKSIRGVHACGCVVGNPYNAPDNAPDTESDWKVDIGSIQVVCPILSVTEIESRALQLLEVSIMKGGQQQSRRVHSITHQQWLDFKQLRPQIGNCS